MDNQIIKEMRNAIKNNDIDTVKELIAQNEGLLDVETVFGTFLHDAATNNKYEIAEYLIEQGIDVNRKGGVRKSSALTTAAFKGHIELVKLLYGAGALLDTTTFESNPLFAAIFNGHLDVVKFLVTQGIDTKVTYPIGDLDSVDACEYARQYGQTEILNYLQSV